MTNAEYEAYLAGCNFSETGVSKLVTSSYTNVMFDNKVLEYQLSMPLGAQNFFGGFFGSEVWQDGQGYDIIKEYATDPYIPFTFSHFVKQTQVCDPNYANECDADLCEIPEGGRGTLPGIQWYKWGFQTKRTCIANIRHIRQFRYWAAKVIRNRALIDERVMYMFYVMAAIKTAGHKITMQGELDANGNLQLVASNDPRNPAPYGRYNFMQDYFPQVTNPETMMPITMQYLEALARRYELFPQGSPKVGTNSRGGDIFELWVPDDLYQQEVLKNPDYMKSLRYTMPNSLFAGYSLKPGDAEIIGNWKFRVMPQLPRFAPNAEGQIVPVDTHVEVPIEVGSEALPSNEFENAPFGLAMVVTGRQGTIMTRPTLTTSGEGFPIQPIASSEPWQINNEYDKDCNKFRNKPFSYRRYEMGFRLDDPNAAVAWLFRRRVFAMTPLSNCDLAPIVYKESNAVDCPLTTVGCNNNKERVVDGITQPDNPIKKVECSSDACNIDGSGVFAYRLKIKRIPNQPDFNSLGCACGDPVTVFVHNDEGVYVRQEQGVVKSTYNGFPYAVYVVELEDALADGECIRGVTCADETPLGANVLSSFDATSEGAPADFVGIGFILDGPIGCDGAGDDVKVRYYSANGLVLGTVDATIQEADVNAAFYRITSVSPNFKKDPNAAFTGAVSIGISCNETGEVSSSSSGS